jgi:hypothetical protein
MDGGAPSRYFKPQAKRKIFPPPKIFLFAEDQEYFNEQILVCL